MNPVRVTLQLAAAVGNGICESQSASGAQALTLNGSLVTGGVATMDVARRVLVSSTGNDSGITFTVAGGDRYGQPISEVVSGTNAASAYTRQDFLTVTSVRTSGATASSVTVGTNSIGSTQWFAPSREISPVNIGIGVWVSGTVNYSVEHTYDDPNAGDGTFSVEPTSSQPPVVWPDAILASKTAQAEGGFTMPIFAYRLTVNSGTGAATMQAIQAGIAG